MWFSVLFHFLKNCLLLIIFKFYYYDNVIPYSPELGDTWKNSTLKFYHWHMIESSVISTTPKFFSKGGLRDAWARRGIVFIYTIYIKERQEFFNSFPYNPYPFIES